MTSFESGDSDRTTCEQLCPRALLANARGNYATDVAMTLPDTQENEGVIRRAVVRSVLSTLASAPANVRAVWVCPERNVEPDEWEPTQSCVEKARTIGPSIVDAVRVTTEQGAILKELAVPLRYEPYTSGT